VIPLVRRLQSTADMGERFWGTSVVVGVACIMIGCAGESSGGHGSAAAARGAGSGGEDAAQSATREAFESELQWLDRTYADCQRQIAEKGECVVDVGTKLKPSSIVVTGSGLRPQNIGEALQAAKEKAEAFSRAVGEVARNGVCNLLAPMADAQSPYLWLGAQVSYAAAIGGQGNVDLVYDLRRRQAAVFTSVSNQIGTTYGASAGAYAGMAFGSCNDPNRPNTNLLEAWQTPNCAASVGISTPWDILGVDVQAMSAANGCMRGATVGLSVGVSAVPLPASVSVSRQVDGIGGPWNAATEGLSRLGQGSRTLECRERSADGSCAPGKAYVQFSSARDMAIHLALQMGREGAIPAAMVLAVDELDSRGIGIEQACPNEVARERARRTPSEQIQAICNPSAVQQNNTPPREEQTPCASKENDDYCGSEIGWASATAKVTCVDGLVKAVYECESDCKREYGYAYCF
jgi:hypothetical protein